MANLSITEAVQALAAGPQVHVNMPVAQLIESALMRGEGRLAANGALVADTAARTGRSPKDKFTVDDAVTHELVDWGKVNQPFPPERFDALLERVLEHMRSRDLFVQDLYCGADPAYRLPIRVITEYAWHALFVRQLFVRPEPCRAGRRTSRSSPSSPRRSSRPCRSATEPDSGAFILADFTRHIILIGGTKYAGEMKKSIFGVMNFLVPDNATCCPCTAPPTWARMALRPSSSASPAPARPPSPPTRPPPDRRRRARLEPDRRLQF